MSEDQAEKVARIFRWIDSDWMAVASWYGYSELHHLKDRVDDRMCEAMLRYLLLGLRPGGFLTCLLSNLLVQSLGAADEDNINAIEAYAGFLNTLPGDCWGSNARVEQWILMGGAIGQMNLAPPPESSSEQRRVK